MAHALKYNFKWTDTGGNNREFEIYEDGFAGTAESIPYSAVSPMSVRMRGDQENTDNIINGQEFTFEIVVSDPTNRHKFDPLFESDFKDFYGQYKKNGTVVNKGWLKPENLEKDAENPQPRITLSFTDGLADLKDIEFRKSDGSFYTGEMTMIEAIKEALSKMGGEIADRDFRIVSNLYEFNEMTTDASSWPEDSALRVSTIDMRRFVKIEGGKTKADNCYRVIEKILFNFNVKLKVENDQYWIVDYQESAYADENLTNGETYVHEITWSDLTASGHSRSKINNVVDLGGKQYRRGGNLTKLPPLNGYDLRYKNKYLGSLPDADVNDWSNWTVTGDVSNSVDGNGVLTVRCDSANDTCMITSPEFDITQEANEEYLKLIFSYILDNFISNPGGTVHFYPQVLKGFSDSWFTSQTEYFGTRWFQYVSPNNPGGAFRVGNIVDPATYQIRLILNITGDAEVKFQPPELRKIVPVGTIGGQTVTRDKGFSIRQTGGRGVEELESYFGDAEDQFDIGRITIGGNVTSVWNHLRNERLSISEQILKHKLTNRQSYGDIIRFDYLDTDDDITVEKVIKIGSNYYEIIGLDKEYRQGNATVTVRQLFTSIVTYTITNIKLGSADDSTTQQGYGDTGGSDGGGGSGGGGSNPMFFENEWYQDDDFFFNTINDQTFNFNNVNQDRSLFNIYENDFGDTDNFLSSIDYDFSETAFKINQANLDLDQNDITNINNFGGGGSDIGVNDDLDFGGSSSLTNINNLDFGGTTVNNISTTIDGSSTNNEFVTALAVKNYVDNQTGGSVGTLQNVTNNGNESTNVLAVTDNNSLPTSGQIAAMDFGSNNTEARFYGWDADAASFLQVQINNGLFVNASGELRLGRSSTVNVSDIVTTIDGASTDSELATAAAVNDRITGWSLEDARGVDNVMTGGVQINGGNLIIIPSDYATGAQVNFDVEGGHSGVSILSDDGAGGVGQQWDLKALSNNTMLQIRDVTNLVTAVEIDTTATHVANFAGSIDVNGIVLGSGTSVNEIVTTIDGASTDDQLVTAEGVWSAIQSETGPFTLQQTLNAGNTATGDDIRDLGNLLVNLNTLPGDHHVHFADGDNDGIVRVFDGRSNSTNWAMEIITSTTEQGYTALKIEDLNAVELFEVRGDGNVRANGLPTSSGNTPSGTGWIWNDGGTLKIT